MYLRTTRQRRKHGPDAIYYQLAENYYHKTRRRSETRVIYTFGRADQVEPEALRRLAQSILRVANDECIDLPAQSSRPRWASTTSSRSLTMVSCMRPTPCGKSSASARCCARRCSRRVAKPPT